MHIRRDITRVHQNELVTMIMKNYVGLLRMYKLNLSLTYLFWFHIDGVALTPHLYKEMSYESQTYIVIGDSNTDCLTSSTLGF